MGIVHPGFYKMDESPIIPAKTKFECLLQAVRTQEKQPERLKHYFKRYYNSYCNSNCKEEYSESTLRFYSKVVHYLITYGDEGLELSLQIIHDSDAPVYDYIGCFCLKPIEILTALAYDVVEYIINSNSGVSIKEVKQQVISLGYPEIVVSKAIVEVLEDATLNMV